MDYLFTSLLQHCKEQGYEGFNLGLVVFSGVVKTLAAPPLEKGCTTSTST
jgi:phosphatidylglycerol lysyltransferase